ncbi:MAG: hypothetical protein D6767_07190 [Candidatus Hydrogenedentota bacterium]|nr:MAG: hypothetical protein D6767_07190 [Candidatus Hydrogenedentota bacterium]
MKLYLLRHAKSDWSNSQLADIDRPLAEKGIRQCKALQSFCNKNQIEPDRVLCSPSKRTKETLHKIFDQKTITKAEFPEELYLASAETILNLVSEKEVDSLLVIAHNPGLEEFINGVTGARVSFGTGCFAKVELSRFPSSRGVLKWFVRPKIL